MMVHGSSDRAAAVSVGTGRCCAAGRGGVAGRHVARGQLDGEAAERVHYSTLYGGSDLRVSFAKSSHVVELHFCSSVRWRDQV